MVRDLKMPMEIVRVPTVREPDGLAMSSRNLYLSPEERQAATALSRGLFVAGDLFVSGERNVATLLAAARDVIDSEPLITLQYLELRDAETLGDMEHVDRPAVLAIAAFVGQARLIDNVLLKR
jgi:pantoate--beta-alanine ligase